MPNFLFEFTDTTIQAVSTIIVADTLDEAEAMFDAGDWEAHINGEEVTDRSEVQITEVEVSVAQEHGWRPIPVFVEGEWKHG